MSEGTHEWYDTIPPPPPTGPGSPLPWLAPTSSGGFPLQLGGLTTSTSGAPLTAAPAPAPSPAVAPAPLPTVAPAPTRLPTTPTPLPTATAPLPTRTAPPPMPTSTFPGAATPPLGAAGGGRSTSGPPPNVAPPHMAGNDFLPPNYQARLNDAGFFGGAGGSAGQLDPNEWLKQLFGGLAR
jgi:hypothetical protein